MKQPAWIEYSGSFFPVIALVFCLRSFLYEPFKIPSSSMVPTLLVGDLILVNKFTYGIRLPVINKKIIEVNQPQRGDVMVFKYPKDMSVDYIKRVVGVPGDKIVYKNKRLTVNGEQISYKALPDYLDEENLTYYKQWQENLTGVEHKILTDERAPNFVPNPMPSRIMSCAPTTPKVLPARCRRAILHDGRQPGQQPRQPLLGLRAGPEHRRQGLLCLDEPGRYQADRQLPLRRAAF
jgi:signal peptidase I